MPIGQSLFDVDCKEFNQRCERPGKGLTKGLAKGLLSGLIWRLFFRWSQQNLPNLPLL